MNRYLIILWPTSLQEKLVEGLEFPSVLKERGLRERNFSVSHYEHVNLLLNQNQVSVSCSSKHLNYLVLPAEVPMDISAVII